MVLNYPITTVTASFDNCKKTTDVFAIKNPLYGSFTNYVDKILDFFDHPPSSVDIFYLMNVDKKLTFLDTSPLLL